MSGLQPLAPTLADLAASAAAGLIAMAVAFVAILVTIELYDLVVGARSRPAPHRRLFCWIAGHDDAPTQPGGLAPGCRRCARLQPGSRR